MHPSHRRSRKQESSIAKDFGGRVTPASGAMFGSKDDGRANGLVRFEAKTTDKSWYRFNPRDWIPLRRRALNMGEEPMFQIDLSQGRLRIALSGWDLGVPPRTGIRRVVEAGATKCYRFDEPTWSWEFSHEDCVELRFTNLTLYAMPYDVCLERLKALREQSDF